MARRKLDIKSRLREVEHRLDVTERKLQSARTKVQKLESRKASLTEQRQKIKLSGGAIFGPHTRKNQNLYLAWAAIERRFQERDAEEGLPTSALLEAARNELLRLHEVTFRSYLARFRNEGLVTKDGTRWHRKVRKVTVADISSQSTAAAHV